MKILTEENYEKTIRKLILNLREGDNMITFLTEHSEEILGHRVSWNDIYTLFLKMYNTDQLTLERMKKYFENYDKWER